VLDEASAKQIAHAGKLNQTTKLLVCLAVGDNAKKVAEIRQIGKTIGLAGIAKWNVSQLLSSSSGAINTTAGWELNQDGRKTLESLAGPLLSIPAKAATSLRAQLSKIKNGDTREFVEQAISCFEFKQYRAAVVLSWVGAMALLYDYVVTHELVSFNAEANKRNSKWKDAKTADDLALMKEYDFLQVLQAISVIGKNVKQELEPRLQLRNGCGHPNSLKIAEHSVASHIEILILNVFAKF
jgi:hypothetical protein